jgi:hypothetical protein
VQAASRPPAPRRLSVRAASRPTAPASEPRSVRLGLTPLSAVPPRAGPAAARRTRHYSGGRTMP